MPHDCASSPLCADTQNAARLTRRSLLRGGLALGCSAAAFPLLSHATFAAAPTETRLIVIILRGAMDGLDVVRPAGDPHLLRHRPGLAATPGLALDDFWQLHPHLDGLMPLWQAGELGFVQAVSTPYRDKRSHFDGQDLLEAGTAMDAPPQLRRIGWLNRLLADLPNTRAETAFAIGREMLPVLAGPNPVQRWSPETTLDISAQARRLLEALYETDPPFHLAANTALDLTNSEEESGKAMTPTSGRGGKEIAEFAKFTAERMRADTRIAAFSMAGWDTHARQDNAILRPLGRLQEMMLALRTELGPLWEKTALLAMTEFGRTVRENGSLGTDHGTGGLMITAGGAIRGGKVLGHWPGLSDDALYAGRDLQPTGDVRAVAGWVMHGLMGVGRSEVETKIFPGVDLGVNPGIV